jgi:hypothetical protein
MEVVMQHDQNEHRKEQSGEGAARDAQAQADNRADKQTDTRTAAQKEEAQRTDPQRTSQRPRQTAEVPLGTGTHGEPPGGGGRESQRVSQDTPRDKTGRH